MKDDERRGLTDAEIGNAIDAVNEAIRSVKSLMDSNLLHDKSKEARLLWSEADQNDYSMWQEQLKRFRALRQRLKRFRIRASKGESRKRSKGNVQAKGSRRSQDRALEKVNEPAVEVDQPSGPDDGRRAGEGGTPGSGRREGSDPGSADS